MAKATPRGLTAERVAPYTRIVTIADTYDALSSDRVYKKGKTHLESIKIMTQSSGDHLDSGLVIKFIESLGIYPPGNLVELSDGEVAVVIETNPVKKLKPKITMLLDENKKRVKPRLVDLSKVDLDASGQPYSIKRMVRPEDYDIDLNLLYKMGVVANSLRQYCFNYASRLSLTWYADPNQKWNSAPTQTLLLCTLCAS